MTLYFMQFVVSNTHSELVSLERGLYALSATENLLGEPPSRGF